MEIPFEHRQEIVTEEMEVLRKTINGIETLKKGYEKLGEAGYYAGKAIADCIALLNEHVEDRANTP